MPLTSSNRRSNEFEKALTEYKQALAQEKAPQLQIRRCIGLLYQAHKDFENAIPELEWIRGELPNDIDVRMSLAISYAGRGRPQEALAGLQAAQKLDPADTRVPQAVFEAYALLGDEFYHRKRYNDAADAYMKSSRIMPAIIIAADCVSDSWEFGSKPLRTFRKPRNWSPRTCSRRDLARCLSEQGKYEDALQILSLPADANLPAEYLLDLVNAYAALDRYADALKTAQRINLAEGPDKPLYDQLLLALQQLASSPEIFQAHAMFADATNKLKNYTIAIAEYRKAIALNPDNWELHKYLGNALYGNNNLPEAAAEWAKVLEQNPTDSLTINNLGTAYDGLDRPEEALAKYQRAADLNPSNFVAFYNLGTRNYRFGRIEDARVAFEQAKTKKEDFAPIHYNLGNCYYRLENLHRATEEWEEAKRLNPNFSEALFNLGVALWKSGEREQAKEKWQAALRSDRNFAAAEDNLEAAAMGAEPDLEIRDLIRGR